MKPSLALDPALLAMTALAPTEVDLENALSVLTNVAQALRSGSEFECYMLSEAPACLAKADLFPAEAAVRAMLDRLNLQHVYTYKDILLAFNNVLQRAQSLEELTGIEFMVPDVLKTSPPIAPIAGATAELLDAMHLTLLHLALFGEARKHKLARAIIATHLVDQDVEICADIAFIEPPLSGINNIQGFRGTVSCLAGVDGQTINKFSAGELWRNAINDEELFIAIKIGALRYSTEGGTCCTQFTLGPHFRSSLTTCQAEGGGAFSATVFEVCSRLIAGKPKYETKEFRVAAGKEAVRIRGADGAMAFRTHVTKSHEGLRLMFWRTPSGEIELSRVAPKHDLVIL